MASHPNTQSSSAKGPYTSRNPIPTIKRFKEEKKDRIARAEDFEALPGDQRDVHHHQPDAEHQDQLQSDGHQPDHPVSDAENEARRAEGNAKEMEGDDQQPVQDTSEIQAHTDPKKQRKAMKKKKDERAEREVTDPITHLPIKVHDFTKADLKEVPDNERPAEPMTKSSSDLLENFQNDEKLRKRVSELASMHETAASHFPPPKYESVHFQLSRVIGEAVAAGLVTVSAAATAAVLIITSTGSRTEFTTLTYYSLLAACFTVCLIAVAFIHYWGQQKIARVWQNELWEAEREQGKKFTKSGESETTQWLNSLLASVWPLINPDLFMSVADTLEDVMQASLPKVVRMCSVEDLGQGSQAIRILGVRWLPTGAATKSVSVDNHLVSGTDSDSDIAENEENEKAAASRDNDAADKAKKDGDDNIQNEQDNANIAQGMEAESGDFVNMEIAFSYRSRGSGKSMHNRANNAHLYLAFYLFGGIKFPVWVELHGLVGVMRLRIQLTPDPPFFSLCTISFLGQPKVDLSCVPLSKKGLNIMDLPLISKFVQSAIDAGLSTLVAPRSMSLDLKQMLTGDGFKKDSSARGVLVVTIKRGFDFKQGDTALGPLKKGSADPYVSVGWAKFGKPMWSTRVILEEMEPCWNETAFLLVSPEELDVQERLRVQLWDSDRMTADDDLGRIEVDLHQLIKSSLSREKMWEREDGFRALKKGEGMPGKLQWAVGYYPKLKLQESQIERQISDPEIRTMEDLKQRSYEQSEQKLREASKDESAEIEQQKEQDYEEKLNELVISAPPSEDHPMGILSIQIHQITGLEFESVSRNKASKDDAASDEEEDGDDLPSSYCVIILNHQKVFRTRTKPKNGKPFFNAGTERVVKDWRDAEIHIAVRDSRTKEDDPLLGLIYLPLKDLLADRSQVCRTFPIAGGIGFGRARVSVVFRSITLQPPKSMIGWDYGTLELSSAVQASKDLDSDLQGMRLKMRTATGKGKVYSTGSGSWEPKSGRPIRIPVKKRYSTPMIIEFRNDRSLRDSTAAFAVLWLKDLVDNEEQEIELPVWRGSDNLKRAEKCCLESCGEQAGHVKFKISFWSGLSGYHNKLADKDDNLADVLEILDAANDNEDMDLPFTENDEQTSSSSDSDDDTPETSDHDDSLSNEGKRGAVDTLKDYKKHRKQLHRKNRGLMQWKGARTLKWVESKVKGGQSSVANLFNHEGRESGIETEV